MECELDGALARVAARLRASTVRVHDGGRGSGAGIVWNAHGLVITNAHVVRGGRATIELADGDVRRAELAGRDPSCDLAALYVSNGRDLEPCDVRDSSSVVPGEIVFAAGNPLGITGAVSAGIVHRCNARWVVADVRLAPGNSGGPLADAHGRVIGVNSMIARGLALAVPTASIRAFLDRRLRAA